MVMDSLEELERWQWFTESVFGAKAELDKMYRTPFRKLHGTENPTVCRIETGEQKDAE